MNARRSKSPHRARSVSPAAGRHRVELLRRRVADAPRPQPHSAGLGQLDVLTLGALIVGVVHADAEHDPVRVHRAHRHLATRAAATGRTPRRRTHRRPQPGARRREAVRLSLRGQQVEDRVVGDEHQRRTARRAGRRPCRRATTRTRPARSLSASRASIAALASTPVTSRARRRQRDREAAGADAELEDPAPPAPARASSSSAVTVASTSLIVAVPVVVHVGEPVAVRRGAVARACSPSSPLDGAVVGERSRRHRHDKIGAWRSLRGRSSARRSRSRSVRAPSDARPGAIAACAGISVRCSARSTPQRRSLQRHAREVILGPALILVPVAVLNLVVSNLVFDDFSSFDDDDGLAAGVRRRCRLGDGRGDAARLHRRSSPAASRSRSSAAT